MTKINTLSKVIEDMEKLGMDTTLPKQQLATLQDSLAADTRTLEATVNDERAVLEEVDKWKDDTASLAKWIPEARITLQAKAVAGTISDQLAAQAVCEISVHVISNINETTFRKTCIKIFYSVL